MLDIRSVFVEKKKGFNVEAQSLLNDFRDNLGVADLEEVRLVNKYVIADISEEYYKKALHTIFSEATVDVVYESELPINEGEVAFGVEFLPGQYDQRADSASECLALLTAEDKVEIKCARIVVLKGNISQRWYRKN